MGWSMAIGQESQAKRLIDKAFLSEGKDQGSRSTAQGISLPAASKEAAKAPVAAAPPQVPGVTPFQQGDGRRPPAGGA
jgi:hypothetical protein